MHAPLCSPLRGVMGKYKSDAFTFFRRNDRQFIRRYTPPSDPRTDSQMVMRQRFLEAKHSWSRSLSETHRKAWKQWALTFTNPRGIANIAGFNAFVTVEMNRMALGLSPGTAPPANGPPGRVLDVEQLPVDQPGVFRFRLWHSLLDFQGARILVETTPATIGIGRAPREGDLRRAAGVNAESFLDLKASGEVYELRGAMHQVQPGQRFGLRVRLFSTEVVAGDPFQVDWERMDFADSVPSSQSLRSVRTKHATCSSFKNNKRSRELDRIQKEQLEAFWNMLERLYKVPWRPPWMPRRT